MKIHYGASSAKSFTDSKIMDQRRDGSLRAYIGGGERGYDVMIRADEASADRLLQGLHRNEADWRVAEIERQLAALNEAGVALITYQLIQRMNNPTVAAGSTED